MLLLAPGPGATQEAFLLKYATKRSGRMLGRTSSISTSLPKANGLELNDKGLGRLPAVAGVVYVTGDEVASWEGFRGG